MGTGHDHGRASSGGGLRSDFRLAIAFGLTGAIVVAQAAGSVVTGSLALLTDTAHALADSTGLLVALIAATLARRPPDSRRTWGFRRVEVLAALGQAALLVLVGIYAAVEGIRRLFEPPEIAGEGLLIFGIIGLGANAIALLVLASSRTENFNLRAAFLEVLNDAFGSLGVIVAAIVIATTGFQQADAIASLLIAALIVPRAVVLLRETSSVLMEFAPAGLDLEEVRRHVLEIEHVHGMHDLHASTIATGLPTVSAHVVVDEACFTDGRAAAVLIEIRDCVASHFPVSVEHSTFQLETEQLHGAGEALLHP